MKKAGVIFLLLTLAVVVGVFVMQQARQDIHQTVEQFFASAAQGQLEAAEYLHENFPGDEALLTALAQAEQFYLESIESIHLQSLSRATASLELGLGERGTYVVDAELERTPQGWKLSSFPELTLVPVALVLEASAQTVTFLTGDGQTLTLEHDDTIMPVSGDEATAGMVIGVGTELAHFAEFEPVLINKLLTVTADTLEGELTGFFTLAEETAYFRSGEITEAVTSGELIVGMENIYVYRWEDAVKAVLMPAEHIPATIRVALNTTDFTGLLHQEIRISADSALLLEDRVADTSISSATGSASLSARENEIVISLPTGDNQIFANRLFITAEGRIRVDTISRGNPRFTPAYPGHLEVRAINGGLQLVNEVPLDAYLYSVVPSEMPVSFGVEPLKVQAVAARSYAVASIYRSGFRSFAAHVDDSVSSQVYNNVPEYAASTQAVNETSGRILTYNQEIADTRFFSTSSGVTANSAEVWHDPETGAFPSFPVSYLVARSQLKSGELPDVTSQEGARAFFTTNDWDGFDQASPWYRWKVEMTRAELEASITEFLPARHQAQPDYVLTEENGQFVSKEIPADPIGELKDLQAIRRGEGGNIMELEIVGENGTYRLLKEYTIRFTLRPVRINGPRDILLERHDGSTLPNYTILPSTFMVIDLLQDSGGKVDSIYFRGGGNGHGVGMSQYGARGMAQSGYSYEDILQHFYPGTTIEQLY